MPGMGKAMVNLQIKRINYAFITRNLQIEKYFIDLYTFKELE